MPMSSGWKSNWGGNHDDSTTKLGDRDAVRRRSVIPNHHHRLAFLLLALHPVKRLVNTACRVDAADCAPAALLDGRWAMTPFRVMIVGFFLLVGASEPDKFGLAIGAGLVFATVDWLVTGNRGQGYAMWVPTLLFVLVAVAAIWGMMGGGL